MAGLINKMTGVCWKCTEHQQHLSYQDNPVNPCTRTFDLVRGYIGGRVNEVVDCWECRECHTLVPIDTWNHYVRNGEVIIRQPKRRK